MGDRYARNDLKEWLRKHGKDDPSAPPSPRFSPKRKNKAKGQGGEGKNDEGGEVQLRPAANTGTA